MFFEKPPAKSLRELKPIENFMKDSNLKLMYGFNHRFHSSIIKAKQIIDRYELGKIINMKGIYGKSKMISLIKLIGEQNERNLAVGFYWIKVSHVRSYELFCGKI